MRRREIDATCGLRALSGSCTAHVSDTGTATTHPREEDAASQEQQLIQLAARLAAYDLHVKVAEVLLQHTDG